MVMAKPIVAGKVPAKKVVTKSSRAADEQQIKQALVKAKHLGKAKFAPIKIEGKFAITSYTEISKSGEETPADAMFLLKKAGSKWSVATYYVDGAMTSGECKRVGLPASTAKKFNITIVPGKGIYQP